MLSAMYLTIAGKTTGKFSGSKLQDGHDGKILIQEFRSLYDLPADTQKGMNLGINGRGVLTLTKEMDKSSPSFVKSIGHREKLTQFELEIHQPKADGSGESELAFTIILEDGVVVKIDMHSSNPLKEGGINGALGFMEDISFAYETLKIKHAPSKDEGTVSWGKTLKN